MRSRSEQGATALIVAASLLFILGIAAIAIDGGRGWSERRQSQNAADFAAIAALQAATSCDNGSNPATPTCTLTESANEGAAEAIQVVQQNFPGATFDWGACADPGRDVTVFTRVADSTACVSFSTNFNRARVLLPDHAIDTTFGRAIGVPDLVVDAEAEAEQLVLETAAVIPFSIGGGPLACLFSNQAPQSVAPCDGPTTGGFGYLDMPSYGNPELGTTEKCISDPNGRISQNIALGSDHLIAPYTTGDVVNDLDACPNLSETVNELNLETGSATGPITKGLIEGITSPATAGRLECAGSSCQTVRTASLDDVPLWDHLAPGACPGTDTRDEMEDCINNYTGGVIFRDTIDDTGRFAAVPRFTVTPTLNGPYVVAALEPVYLATLFADCDANKCGTVFSPGETTNSTDPCPDPLDDIVRSCGFNDGNWSGSGQVEALSAFLLQESMLPASVLANFPGGPSQRDYALTK